MYQTCDEAGKKVPDRRNVKESIKLFQEHTLLSEQDAHAVSSMIAMTANHLTARTKETLYAGFRKDAHLFLDLDLSPLAANWEKFQYDTRCIRHEFFWASDDVFFRARKNALGNFIRAGEKLYRCPETRAIWGRQAQHNLNRAHAELSAAYPN